MGKLLNTDQMYDRYVQPKNYEAIRNGALASRRPDQRRLLLDLLLYDQVIFTTVDFSQALLIADAFGLEFLEELLQSKAICFLSVSETIAFFDRDHRIETFEVLAPDKQIVGGVEWGKKEAKTAHAISAFHDIYGALPSGLESLLLRATEDKNLTSTIALLNDEIMQDFIQSETIRNLYPATRLSKVWNVKVAEKWHVTKIDDSSMRRTPADVVQALLRIAHSRLNLYLGAEYRAYCLSSPLYLKVLHDRDKQDRSLRDEKQKEFRTLLEIHQIPNLESAIQAGTLTAEMILNARASTAGKQFREIVDSALCAGGGMTLSQAFIELLEGRATPVENKLKWLLVQALDLVAGNVAGIVGEQLLDRYSQKGQAIAFMDQLRDISLGSSHCKRS